MLKKNECSPSCIKEKTKSYQQVREKERFLALNIGAVLQSYLFICHPHVQL